MNVLRNSPCTKFQREMKIDIGKNHLKKQETVIEIVTGAPKSFLSDKNSTEDVSGRYNSCVRCM